MSIAVILAVLSGETSDTAVLDAALPVARRTGARIRALHVRSDPNDVLLLASPDGLLVSQEIIDFTEREIARAAKRASDAFETWRAKHAAEGAPVVAEQVERSGELGTTLAREGQAADLIVVASHAAAKGRGDAELETALFETGRPVLIAPKRVHQDMLAHPMIAWKPSPQAAHAVAAALPLLEAAERIEVFAADDDTLAAGEPGIIVPYLAAHGLQGFVVGFEPGSKSVGAALLGEAARHKATLLVLGAYGHSRLRELILGGVTQHVLDHAEIAVLMMH